MKRTRAATKAGDGATAADDGNASKAASRRVKVKVPQPVLCHEPSCLVIHAQ